MIGVRPKTTEEHNKPIYEAIATKENELTRPMRELLSTTATAESKAFAQSRIDTIETEIQALRGQLK